MATWSDRWAELAGDAVAAASAPTKVLDGVLTVRCDAPVWATQLRLTWPEVQARARALGLEVPGRLEVVVRPR
jgi:predicted nucleic acid-binding Zn ribbon protein